METAVLAPLIVFVPMVTALCVALINRRHLNVQDKTIHEIHVMVNSQKTEAEQRIVALEAQLSAADARIAALESPGGN